MIVAVTTGHGPHPSALDHLPTRKLGVLPLPACGERVGVRGMLHLGSRESPSPARNAVKLAQTA